MEQFLKYLGNIADAWIKIEEKIGLRKIIYYVFLGLAISLVLNFRSVVKNSIELVAELNEEMHNEKMLMRDQLLSELYPMLVDYRSSVDADRLLYFEYHNSKEIGTKIVPVFRKSEYTKMRLIIFWVIFKEK